MGTLWQVPLIKGRYFDNRDRMDAPKVVIVNESFVNRYLPGEEAIGKHLTIDFGPEPFKSEIVVVVGSIRHSSRAQPRSSRSTARTAATRSGGRACASSAGTDALAQPGFNQVA